MKTVFSLILLAVLSLVTGQQQDAPVLNIDSITDAKGQDFNRVFVPFYNSRDTLKYNELLIKSRKNNYILGEIIALNLLGTIYRDQSKYKPSILLHDEALQLSEKHKNTDGILYSTNMLGVVYRRMDNVERGLAYHFDALQLAEKVKPATDFSIRNTAIAVNGIGNAYLILREWNSAQKQFKRSIDIERSIDNQLGLAINYQNIGITFEEMYEADSAMVYYQKSLSENTAIGNEVGKMICYNSIAGLLMKQDKFREALGYINRAENIAIQKGDNFYTTTIYLKKAKVMLALQDSSQAEQYMNKSREISSQHNLMANLAETHAALSTFYSTRGDYKNALHHSQMSKEVETNFLNENNLRIKNNLEISYDVAAKASQILNLEQEKAEISNAAEQRQKLIFILILLMITLLLLGLLIYRQTQLKKEKQVLELEQKVLRAQMNPHFTFNALNSIKAYIISQETEKAVKYLNQFAKLIRGVLQSSNKRSITLREELDTLESYVAIEQLRLSGEVEMIVNIQDVDTDDIVTPPLILQPYVENSLWHGLEKKTGRKEIIIDIYPKNSRYINIDITDNGIGRTVAARRYPGKHDSMGTEISRKRLDAFYGLKSQECSVKYTDLKDEQGNARGTKVSICFPKMTV